MRTLLESINDKGLFKAIFLAGIPGAGKSTLIQSIENPDYDARLVDPDVYVEFLDKKYHTGFANDIYRKIVPLKVSQLTSWVNGMLPMYVAGTARSSYNILKRDEILESFGYDTAMIWVTSDIQTAMTNMQMRNRKVSLADVQQAFENLEQNYKTYQQHYGSKFFTFENIFLTAQENQQLQTYLTQSRSGEPMAQASITDMNRLKAKLLQSENTPVQLAQIQKISDKFFGSPIRNGKGRATVDYLQRTGGKYMTDGVISLQKIQEILEDW